MHLQPAPAFLRAPGLARWRLDGIANPHLPGAAAFILLFYMVFMGRDGIEPSTSGLKVRCSTD